MSVYTVYEPPRRAADALADPQRFIFVRDGFYFWAFLLAPFWMIRHRLWLVLALYLVISIGIDVGLGAVGASSGAILLVGFLISLLVGFEAGTLRRFTLQRRGWRNAGTVSGGRLEDAELRFFDTWLRQTPRRNGAPSATSPAAPSMVQPQSSAEGTGVIGLFPEPGASR
jgi:Protein of unknown function (DUF2628)